MALPLTITTAGGGAGSKDTIGVMHSDHRAINALCDQLHPLSLFRGVHMPLVPPRRAWSCCV